MYFLFNVFYIILFFPGVFFIVVNFLYIIDSDILTRYSYSCWKHICAIIEMVFQDCSSLNHTLSFLPFVIYSRYLCKLSDQELRQSAARNMADLMWSTVKEPLDTALCFDKESLDLAFKYFMSPTLTMRLAGLSQITVRTF